MACVIYFTCKNDNNSRNKTSTGTHTILHTLKGSDITIHHNNKHACAIDSYIQYTVTVDRIHYSTSPLFVYFENRSGG